MAGQHARLTRQVSAQHHRRDGPVDLWTALLRRVPAFALRAILWTARGQPWRVAHRPTTGRRLPTIPPARKPPSFLKKTHQTHRAQFCSAQFARPGKHLKTMLATSLQNR
jgi:hypothetical protein